MVEPNRGLMDAIFDPESVAVVGVPEGMKVGRLFLLALINAGYRGRIYPVNPRLDEIDGLKVIKRARDIPGPIDLAIVLVPKKNLYGVIEDLGSVGTRAAVIFTAGLGEMGEDGESEQRELVALARSHNIRLIGPNCQGIYAPKTGLSFLPNLPKESGNVSFVSGSGSLASLTVVKAAGSGIFFSKVISFGNSCDLTASDFFSYLAHDPETEVIMSYIEGIPEGRRFFDTLIDITPRKPVVVWKAGLTDYGARAALSHTGALAGSADLWEGALNQAGAVTAQGMDELVDVVMGLKFSEHPIGNRVAILSGPGGLAVSSADCVERAGLVLAELTSDTQKKIAEILPQSGISVKNPVDVGLGASGEPKQYTLPARYLMEDPNVDTLIVIGGTFSPEMNRTYRKGLISARDDSGKSLFVVSLPEFSITVGDMDMVKELVEAAVPVFPSPERAIISLKKVHDYGLFLEESGLKKCSTMDDR